MNEKASGELSVRQLIALVKNALGLKADKSEIPSAVTEQTVSGWGFTKNSGTYSKPAGGIPASDLASAVQTSLGKADTAIQSHQSLAAYRTSAAQDTIDAGKANTADLADVATSGSYTDLTDKPTIPTVPTNVSAFTNDSGYQTAQDVRTAIEPFVIPITGDEDNWTTTASAADIVDHADNCVMNVYGGNYAPQAVTKYEQTANIKIVLCVIQYGMLFSQNIEVYADKSNNSITISVEIASANLLPTVTASDNGKFLRVVSGAWAAQTVPAAESNSFGGGST